MNLQKNDIKPLIRHVVSFGVGWLVSHNLIPGAQAEVVIGLMTLLVLNVLWAYGERLLHRWGFLTALDLPSGSTPADVAEIAATVPRTERIKEALKAVPEVVPELPPRPPPPKTIIAKLGEPYIRPPFVIEDEESDADLPLSSEDARPTGKLQE